MENYLNHHGQLMVMESVLKNKKKQMENYLNHHGQLVVMESILKKQKETHDDEDNFPFVDYDEYDAQVFKLPTPSLG
jgi:hypothetical protein